MPVCDILPWIGSGPPKPNKGIPPVLDWPWMRPDNAYAITTPRTKTYGPYLGIWWKTELLENAAGANSSDRNTNVLRRLHTTFVWANQCQVWLSPRQTFDECGACGVIK